MIRVGEGKEKKITQRRGRKRHESQNEGDGCPLLQMKGRLKVK